MPSKGRGFWECWRTGNRFTCLLVYWFTGLVSTFHSFEEIQAWQEARTLIQQIRQICKRDVVRKDFAFIDQITRAARSIAANIAEGFESLTIPEFISFLSYAQRSAGETRSHLYDGLDETYLSQEEFKLLSQQTITISKMITGLIQYLRSSDVNINRKRMTPSSISVKTSKPVNQ